jgi:nucleoside phosphorylase
VWVVKTGVGIERAAAAAVHAADAALVVSAGCAGALAPELRPGDVALATQVISAGRESIPTDAGARAGAARAGVAAGLHVVEGPVVCSPTALATAAQKRAAAIAGAIAVEMEGGPLAAYAAAARVRFLSVRAILDTAEYELPIPTALLDPASGTMRPLAVAAYVATHPGALPTLMDLRRMQTAARVSLERFFARWLAGDA